jgi:hypothetical protein
VKAAKIASLVYDLALADFRKWSESHGLSPDFIEKQLPDCEQSSVVKLKSVGEYHEDVKRARYLGNFIIRTLPLREQIADIQKKLAEHPGKRLGTVILGYMGPDHPMIIVDADAGNRPDDGDEVELLGYRFKLQNKKGSTEPQAFRE